MAFLESLNHRFWRVPRRISSYFQVKLYLSCLREKKFCFKRHPGKSTKLLMVYDKCFQKDNGNFYSVNYQILYWAFHIPVQRSADYSKDISTLLPTRLWGLENLSNLPAHTWQSSGARIQNQICLVSKLEPFPQHPNCRGSLGKLQTHHAEF